MGMLEPILTLIAIGRSTLKEKSVSTIYLYTDGCGACFSS